jgi:hypothetical protein
MFFRSQQLGFKKVVQASDGSYQNVKRSNSRNKKNSTNLKQMPQRTTKTMEVLLENCTQVHMLPAWPLNHLHGRVLERIVSAQLVNKFATF